MKTCSIGKRGYPTFELGEEALIGAHIAYNYGKGNGPVSVYQCDECGQFHLTSRGEVNKRLELMLKKGEIDKQKESSRWEEKLRKK